MNILVVEDEILMADMIRSVILSIPNVKNVDIALGYHDAIRKLASKIYHMVLIDIFLAKGRLNGLDLCRIIRGKDPHTPLIMITSDTSFESQKKAFNIYVNDYIKKPFYPQELVLRVQRWLLAPDSKPPSSVKYHMLAYHTPNNEFYFERKKIPLTKRNKALLILFIQHREKILTPDFLQEKLWGDYEPMENKRNVRSNIQVLRQALKKAQCDHWIITVRGEGYMLKKN